MQQEDRELKIGSSNDMLANATKINRGLNMFNGDINQIIEKIITLHDSGGNPQAMMQSMLSKNPNIQQMGTQFNNMKQGRSNAEMYLQLAKQAGLSEKNIQGLSRILGIKQ